MRCPKCQYISFDNGERCRNCGYEFSLSVDAADVEVRIARDEPSSSSRGRENTFSALDAPLNAEDPGPSQFGRRSIPAADLPLFTDRIADDQAPLVSAPAVPRAPLAVRKANVGRPRPQPPLPEELSLNLEEQRGEDARAHFAATPAPMAADASHGAASLVRRFAAGVVDVLILGSISIAVVLLTLRVVGLTAEQWQVLPVVPMLGFLLLLCGGYFVLFTAAGGQTIGKMVARVRVVNASHSGTARVSFSTAVLRTAASLASLLAVGGGFLMAAANDDRCAFHDRVANTRVVPA